MTRNLIWNWTGIVFSMASGFLMAPFLIHRLGDTHYGLWLLLASLTSYFCLFDLGTRSAVGRNVAFYRAKGDQEGVNAVFNTALVLLLGAGLLALGATFLLEHL